MKKLKKYTKEIFIPSNVKIKKKKNNLIISGPLGSTLLNLKKIDAYGSGAVNFTNFSEKLTQNTPCNKPELYERQARFPAKEPLPINGVVTPFIGNAKQDSGPLYSPLLCKAKENAGKNSKAIFSKQVPANLPYILTNTEKKNILTLSSNCKSFFSCFFNIIQNKIIGVSSGFLISIKVIGVGYRVEIVDNKKNEINSLNTNEIKNRNQILYFKIGFSHDFTYVIPSSVRVFLLEQNLICIYGIDKNQVTQIAAKIREIKPPSVYKGKGIRLSNENVFTKPGKKK